MVKYTIKRIVYMIITLLIIATATFFVLKGHHTSSYFRDAYLWNREDIIVFLIETLREVPGELEMLLLILADRDKIRTIEQDIGRHEGRVGEKAGRYGFFSMGLILELSHALKFTDIGDVQDRE